MYHSVLRLIKCTLCEARGKQFEQEESLGGARAKHLSGWRWMQWSKVIWTVPRTFWRVNFSENEWESRRMTEGSCGWKGNNWRMTISEPPFPPISTNWEPCTVKWGSRTSLTLSVPLRYFKKSEKQADKKKKTGFAYSNHGETKEKQLSWVKIHFLALLFKKT